jgi:hypothetical protein
MPNIATHGLLAQDVLDAAPFKSLADIIRRYPKAYFLGSNGPDFLFYYHVLPWQNKNGSERMIAIANRLHAEKIDDFYRSAIDIIKATQDNHLKNAMISFLAGHLTHWSLDSVAHPYIFYKTGPIAGASKYWHSRFESNIDTLMVKEIKGYSLAKFDSPQLVDADQLTLSAVEILYPEILKVIFGIEVSRQEIKESIASFHTAIKLLNDPLTLKFPFIQFFETLAGMRWSFSCHMVTGVCDTQNDILNLHHKPWIHPCDNTKTSVESFIDLYENARLRAVGVLCALDDILHKDYIIDQLITLINDRTYDTGMKNPPEMIHFDPIY